MTKGTYLSFAAAVFVGYTTALLLNADGSNAFSLLQGPPLRCSVITTSSGGCRFNPPSRVLGPEIRTSSSLAVSTSTTSQETTVSTESEASSVALLAEQSTTIDLIEQETIYRRGLLTVGVITVLFASNSPVIHAAFAQASIVPPVLLLNAAVSSVALAGVTLGGPLLDKVIPQPPALQGEDTEKVVEEEASTLQFKPTVVDTVLGLDATKRAGLELGLWKFLGTTANLYGLSLTTADHGAFLIQLTTVLVPAAQGIMGVPIPTRIWTAIGLALTGVFAFVQEGSDPSTAVSASLQGDLLCIVAAVFYATYDLRLFKWGKVIPPLDLISAKVATQASLSVLAVVALDAGGAMDFFQSAGSQDWGLIGAVVVWSGLVVNGIVPYLQVGGQQAIGPARAQILYASQPIWAAMISLAVFGESIGSQGLVGGGLFMTAILLAATAEMPDPDCGRDACEV